MSKPKKLPDYNYLVECFRYNADLGYLFWKNRPIHHFQDEKTMMIWNKKHAGNVINPNPNRDYVEVKLLTKRHFVHRIIWKIVYGFDPNELIDHINGNKHDNRLCNLREANLSQNQHNRRRSYRNNTGYKGVSKHGNLFKSEIGIDGKKITLGYFKSSIDAGVAYMNAAKQMHGRFCRIE